MWITLDTLINCELYRPFSGYRCEYGGRAEGAPSRAKEAECQQNGKRLVSSDSSRGRSVYVSVRLLDENCFRWFRFRTLIKESGGSGIRKNKWSGCAVVELTTLAGAEFPYFLSIDFQL